MDESRRQRKKARREERQQNAIPDLHLTRISPKTDNQQKTFDAYAHNQNLFLHGTAGTGKTFLSFYLALKDIYAQRYQKLVIVRSLVPSRDIGFLPGSVKEKAQIYEGPYYGICTELFNRGDAYDILKKKGFVEFISTSFVRGSTIKDCVLLVDEIQNAAAHEINTIITRVGDNCRVILSGDIRQTDLVKKHDRSGLGEFSKIIKRMKSFTSIEFTPEDILRSDLVREYIITRERMIDEGTINIED